MLGYIEYGGETVGTGFVQRKVLGGSFLALDFGRERKGYWGRVHAARSARKMYAQGVRRAVFPVDFPYTALFLRQGIAPVDALPLRRAVCAGFVRRRMETLGIAPAEAVIAVVGDRLSRELVETTRTLALRFRYVLLSVPEGGEELARSLRREYGVSLLLKPTADQLERSDALVLFAPAEGLSGGNRVFCALYHGGEFGKGRIPLDLAEEAQRSLPPGCDREQLAAALHAMGVLTPEMLAPEIAY